VSGTQSGTIVNVIPNFVSEMPIPVMLAFIVVIICLPIVFIKDALTRSKGVMPAPPDVRKAGKSDEWDELNKHHKPKLRGSRKALAIDVRARLLAPTIPYALCHGNPVNVLAVSDVESTTHMLARDWGITHRSDLLRQLYTLLRSGHRAEYTRLREHCADPSWATARIELLNKTADRDTDAWEERWRIRRLLDNDRGLSSVDFGAWDFVRAALLTRTGAALGWLSEDEAWDTLALVNRALSLSYSSWNEVWVAFRTTRWLWAAEGDAQSAANDLHDRNRGEFLLGKNGLWTAIPWDAPYPTPRFLLLDALREMDALRLLSPSAWEDASTWERELDAQTRTRAPMSIGGKPIVQ
jgi:hypothetical protein